MLNITNSVLLMTSLFNAGLAVFIIRGRWKDITNDFLSVYLFTLSIWSLALIGTQVGQLYWVWLFCTKLTYVSGLIIAASFYLFTISFPDETRPRRTDIIFAYGSTFLFSMSIFFIPSFLINQIVTHSWGNSASLNTSDYLLFTALFCLLYVGGLLRIWIKYFHATGIVRKKLLVIGTGVTVTGLAGLYFDIILASPFIDEFRYIWTGPLFNTVMAGLIVYAVFRLRLFNTKIIITEILIGLLWIFTLVRVFLSIESQDKFFNFVLFIFSVVIGYLLVRSVRAEVEQREEIQHLSDEKSEFMSFASHEIRNPVTAMRGLASLIIDGTTGDVSPQVKDAAQKILVSGDTVLALINQFLNKSKVELGQLDFDIKPFDVGVCVSHVVEEFLSHAELKKLSLEKNIEYPNLMALGDEAKLREVIGNVIDNSVKYTKTGHVRVTVQKHSGKARILIEDTGVGITHDALANLFKKFARSDAQKMNLLGSGLGLYLAKTFIEGMHGKIWAESEGPDRGARFFIELPVA